jgi:Uri superfamily endonuclease
MDITYILIIQFYSNKAIKIGKLGEFLFKRGYYLYIGSARRNIEKRIERHIRKEKKKFWHIDYLLQYGVVKQVWTGKMAEREVSKIMENTFEIPVLGFGSSDMRENKTHLFYGKPDESFLKKLSFRKREFAK